MAEKDMASRILVGIALGGIGGLIYAVRKWLQAKRDIKDQRLGEEQKLQNNATPPTEEILGLATPNINPKKQLPAWRPKFLILLVVFLGAGAVCGIGLSYLFSDSAEKARRNLIEMNITFDKVSFFERTIAGDIVAVSLFLRAGMNPNTMQSGTANLTPLMAASWNGQQSIVEMLLQNGANIRYDLWKCWEHHLS